MTTLNWVFENHPMVTGILTQPSIGAENNLLADEKGLILKLILILIKNLMFRYQHLYCTYWEA